MNITNVSMSTINYVANSSDIGTLFVKINHAIYGGVLWFVLLLLLWFIVWISLNRVENQPLVNVMYSGALVSLVSLLIRGVYIVESGVVKGLLTDHQLWVFPLVTAIVAVIVWSTKD